MDEKPIVLLWPVFQPMASSYEFKGCWDAANDWDRAINYVLKRSMSFKLWLAVPRTEGSMLYRKFEIGTSLISVVTLCSSS